MEMTLENLQNALAKSWGKDTAHRSVRNRWTDKNKALGQCAVTALVVNKYLGGEIMKGVIVGENAPHYWNILTSGEVVDLTKSQFGNRVFEMGVTKKKQPNDILRHKDFRNRYELLDKRVRTVIGL
jgi:hypothetical protein